MSEAFLSDSSPYILRQGTWNGLVQLHRWPASPRDPFISVSPILRLQTRVTMPLHLLLGTSIELRSLYVITSKLHHSQPCQALLLTVGDPNSGPLV